MIGEKVLIVGGKDHERHWGRVETIMAMARGPDGYNMFLLELLEENNDLRNWFSEEDLVFLDDCHTFQYRLKLLVSQSANRRPASRT